MDISAQIQGYDDWAHYEDVNSRSRSIGGAVETMSIVFGRSVTRNASRPLPIDLIFRIAERRPSWMALPRSLVTASLPLAILLSAASVIMYAIAFIDREFVQTTAAAGIFCSFSLIALVNIGRSMIAASIHPHHRSNQRICSMAGYMLGLAMPVICIVGLMTSTDMLRMDHILVNGLVASTLAGPFWIVAAVDILLRRQGEIR